MDVATMWFWFFRIKTVLFDNKTKIETATKATRKHKNAPGNSGLYEDLSIRI